MSKPTLKVTTDLTKQVNDIVKRFKRDSVLVGIPAEDNARSQAGSIGNAALLAIANFGSAARNIPPWPIMSIGIREAQDEIATTFKDGAKKALSGGVAALSGVYTRAGIIASTSVKKVLNSQEGVPNDKPSKATLAARKRFGFLGKKYWIVTGQMRNAITFVVKEG